MPFPTIPTVASGRVLFANQADASATRTFPSLSGLTKNSGDLLIAIIGAYQSTAGAFSSWGASFTEQSDSFTSTTIAIGVAYKWSDGTETGTFTVTQSATITGRASMCLLSIPDAHQSSVPEVSAKFNGTTSTTTPTGAASWGAEDNLFIFAIVSGMTSASGAWTACGSTPPTDYSNWADSNTADSSVVGQTEIAVAFRQLNSDSDIMDGASVDVSNARNSSVGIVVRPAPTIFNPNIIIPNIYPNVPVQQRSRW
jgi:hypothetical protein